MTTGEVIALIKAFGGSGGGGSSGGGVLTVHDVEGTLDKTWQEINDADIAVVLTDEGYHNVAFQVYETKGSYLVITGDTYIASSATGYPVVSQ